MDRRLCGSLRAHVLSQWLYLCTPWLAGQNRPASRFVSPASFLFDTCRTLGGLTDSAKLAKPDISGAVGAKTHITSAAAIPDVRPAPYCRMTDYVEPMVQFEVRLPLTTWTLRFVQTGCGGLLWQSRHPPR